MTTADPTEDLAAVKSLCGHVGLPTSRLRLLHRHATAIYLIPDPPTLVRISPAADQEKLRTTLAVTRWITKHGIPVTEPLEVDQPVSGDHRTATFWTYYPQHSCPTPPAHHLGSLLRRIHTLGHPPIPVPRYRPLTSLTDTVTASTHLNDDDRGWLLDRSSTLLDAYSHLAFPLEPGFIHGDAYPGNTLWDGGTVRLGDWDECAAGPRELDLANTIHGQRRFGRSAQSVQDFMDAYGYGIRDWPGLQVLLDIRDLHTLGAYIRRADTNDAEAARHLAHRLSTLRNRDTSASWVL